MPVALILGLLLLVPGHAFRALELDRGELENAADADIEFENFEGPVDQIDSREEIREIGRTMGRGVRDAGAGSFDARYRARRIIGEPNAPGLAADIIELDEAARVDHIRNLRRIVAGYLESAWDYEAADADLLARFITIYNAVNRGSVTLVEERYRPAVVAALDPPRIGLATSYREWAGQTQLIIPIRDDRAAGALDAVDPTQLVDARVIDELRSRADLGIEDRKAIIDFIERVIEERSEAITTEREELADEQAEIDERQAEIEEEIETIASQEDDPAPSGEPADEQAAEAEPAAETEEDPPSEEPASEPADDPTGTGAATDDAEQTAQADTAAPDDGTDEADQADEADQPTDPPAEEDADERVAALEAERDELAEREQEIADRQEELDDEEAEVAELTDRVEELYEETAEDQATAENGGAPVLVPFILSEGGSSFALAAVNFDEAEVAGTQTIPLASRDAASLAGGLVVAHRDTGELLMVEPASMEIIAEGDAPARPGSRMIVVEDRLLTVIPVDGRFHIGVFDSELTLQRRSAQPVLEQTDIVSRNDQLLVQGTNGRLRVLALE